MELRMYIRNSGARGSGDPGPYAVGRLMGKWGGLLKSWRRPSRLGQPAGHFPTRIGTRYLVHAHSLGDRLYMTISSRSVKVHRFPAHLDKKQTEDLLQALRREAELERPCFVLDCSHAKTIDKPGIFLLLACLEEAMKCNGDVRLASVQPHVAKRLREAGISSLFEIFSTVEAAAHSFRKRANTSAMLTFSEEFIEADLSAVA